MLRMISQDLRGEMKRRSRDPISISRVMLREVRRAETMINRMTTRPGTKL